MDYPTYRQQGLPVTTAWMESLVKEMNYRVKGTEMFWNDPAGAEAILQVRSAALGKRTELMYPFFKSMLDAESLRSIWEVRRSGRGVVRRASLPSW